MTQNTWDISKSNRWKILLACVFLIWWLGPGGDDLFLLPVLFWFVYSMSLLQQNQTVVMAHSIKLMMDWCVSASGKRKLILVLILQSLVWLCFSILKYYSFQLHIWDSGIYSNILYNLSRGDFYLSYFNEHNLADHFTPSLWVLAPLYKIYPSIHWLMLAKTLAYVFTPVLFYRLSHLIYRSENKAWLVSLFLGSLWLLFYTPVVSSMRYEFQVTSLAPPAIVYSMICVQQRHWLRFWGSMVFILGLKESTGSVWIGIGIFMIVNRQNIKTGWLLFVGGIVAMIAIMFYVMPFFNHFQIVDKSPERMINLFFHWDQKLIYSIKLIYPLAGLPLFYWKKGILAGPAIGINLIAGKVAMFSSHYHYDDIPSTLLMLSMIYLLKDIELEKILERWNASRKFWTGFVLWFVGWVALWPNSNMKLLQKVLPGAPEWQAYQEVHAFEKTLSPSTRIAVQDALGPHFNRREIQAFVQHEGKDCSVENSRFTATLKIDYIVLSTDLGHYKINDFSLCLRQLEASDTYQRIPGYSRLIVFANRDSQ
ncbi:MAG: DUF2079 domain-containing protein [SAR324 cluster bacterium]|nr:DUF2079 domain-containing protein [SAR324 cluster bacterium]